MLRRHFLWSSACMLVGCGAQGVEQQKQKICSRPAGFGAYNIYDKWGKTHLTYHMLDRDTADMKRREWDEVWAKSFKCWSDVCPLTFEHISSGLRGWEHADIVIDVNRVAEGFGRKGGILAWAEMPATRNWDSQLWTQFDRAEDWVVEKDDRDDIMLQSVAVHEIGHLLGLGHSTHIASIMYPYYDDLIISPQENDIKAIQTLYGEKK